MEKPTIENLKSRAYDLIAAKEQIDMQLRQTNQMIAELSKEAVEKDKPKEDLKSK